MNYQKHTMKKNYQLLFIALLASVSFLQAQENAISFEAEEGYELGDINQQQGWTTTSLGNGEYTDIQIITEARPKTGTRSLRIINDPNIPSQPFPVMGAFRVLDNPLDKTNFTLGYSINVDAYPGGNSSIFALECGSIIDEKLVLEFYFSYDGNIQIFENNGTDFTQTNVGTWEKDTWYDVTITGDGEDVYYYLNGELVHTGQLLYNIDEIRFAHDNYSGAAFIDDVIINYDVLSVQDVAPNSWAIYPNPVKDILNLEGLNTVESYVIYDVSGRKLEEADNNTQQINLSHLSNGVYLLQVNTDKGQVSKKFIKN